QRDVRFKLVIPRHELNLSFQYPAFCIDLVDSHFESVEDILRVRSGRSRVRIYYTYLDGSGSGGIRRRVYQSQDAEHKKQRAEQIPLHVTPPYFTLLVDL